MAQALRVRGYREFQRAVARADRQTRKAVREELREVGEVVRADAQDLFSDIDATTAAGYRVVVRQRGVSVEQRLRRTTGLHPEYGALQMRRALIPAAEENEDTIEERMERALDRIADRFARD